MDFSTGQFCLRRLAKLLLSVAMVAASASAVAADDGGYSFGDHSHAPVRIPSRPVVERVPVALVHPADVCYSGDAGLLIAEQDQGLIFRVNLTTAAVEIAAKDLPSPVRVTSGIEGSLFVLCRPGGGATSEIWEVAPTGDRVQLASFPFAVQGFARDRAGDFFLTQRGGRRVIHYRADGHEESLVTLPEPITDCCLNSADQVMVLGRSGRIYRAGRDGTLEPVSFVPSGSLRLHGTQDGQVLALANDLDGSRRLYVPAASESAVESSRRIPVSRGTTAVSFDSLGNMAAVNPSAKAVLRVTRSFQTPCPHCGRPMRVDLVPPEEFRTDSVSF